MTRADDGASQLAPRQVAFDVVREVTEHDAYANLVLPKRLRAAGITGRDAAFATEVTYGTLRRLHTYDAVIESCAQRPWGEIDATVLDLLRIGAHQLFFMNVASHAAVATTVELAKRNRMRGASGFVNAVLRRISRSSWEQWMEQLTTGVAPGSDADLALRHAHPQWLVAELRRALVAGDRPESEITDLLVADNEPAPVTLVARPPRSTLAELVAAGAAPGRWSPVAAVLGGGDPRSVPAVRERRAGVQDEGSQLVTLALAGVRPPQPAEKWLDMCAGPGGKAALLASLAARDGAELEAWELHEHRAQLVRGQVPSTTRVLVNDATDPAVVARAEGCFDRVLLDAPCTGAGALRRRPEARWRKSALDLPRLVAGQSRLLAAALTVVRPGGVVAYVTCSPLVEETRGVVDSVVGDGDVDVLDARDLVPEALTPLGPGPYVQLWPHLHGTDAMFLAVLRRSGG